MGKDREGKFHPAKGRPSDRGTKKGIEISTGGEAAAEDRFGITDGEAHDAMRHPNRTQTKRRRVQVSTRKKPSTGETKSAQQEDRSNTVVADVTSFMTREDFGKLDSHTGAPCLSIYLSTHTSGVEVNERHDRIRFKNAIQDAVEQLGGRGEEATKNFVVKTGDELLSNDIFWRNQQKGLAVFISDGFTNVMKLPYAVDDRLLVNDRFYLSPLLPLLENDKHFYLLVLSKKQAKLFRGDMYSLVHVDIPDMPDGIEDVVHFEQKDGQGLFRTGSSGAGGGANYHGLGESGPDHKENIALYMKEVDRTLHEKVLGQESAPLVIAGVEYLVSIFEKNTSYAHVWKDHIPGNAEHEDIASLHATTKAMLQPWFGQSRQRAIETYGVKSNTSLISTQPSEIVAAAHYSRVSMLFIEDGFQLWGKFDEKNNSLVIHQPRKQLDDDLVDRAAVATIRHGGNVFFLSTDKMPAGSGMAAVMRFDG